MEGPRDRVHHQTHQTGERATRERDATECYSNLVVDDIIHRGGAMILDEFRIAPYRDCSVHQTELSEVLIAL